MNSIRFLLAIVLGVILGMGGSIGVHGQQQSPPSVEETTSRWPKIKGLIESKDFSQAARLAVDELEGDYPDRRYAMWKWWEAVFGTRKDYMELSGHFGDALFHEYDQSGVARRRVITEIFGRPKFDVSKPARDLRATIETGRKSGDIENKKPSSE